MAEKATEKTIEKVFTVPLRSEWVKEPRSKRSNRAIREVKIFVSRHTKSKDVKISKGINELIFSRGFQKPPSRVKIEVSGDLEKVMAKLPGEVIEEKIEKKEGAIAGLRERLGGGKGEAKEGKKELEARKKELKDRVEKEIQKELTKEKVDALVEKAIKEEETKADKKMPAKVKKAEDAVEKELEKVEKAEEKTVEKAKA
jgi:large subunit ribosomal protein L31e